VIDTILLAVIAAGVVAHVALVARPPQPKRAPGRPAAAPSAPQTPPTPRPTPHDLRVEKLIQQVDPTWKLGDPRDHVELIPGPDGHIASARVI
jgi:hypothetical protein